MFNETVKYVIFFFNFKYNRVLNTFKKSFLCSVNACCKRLMLHIYA